MKIYVKYLDKNGWDSDTVEAREKGLVKGEKYLMDDIDIGGSFSYVQIDGIKGRFNSVMFDFYDKYGNEIDIFETEYNPYRRF